MESDFKRYRHLLPSAFFNSPHSCKASQVYSAISRRAAVIATSTNRRKNCSKVFYFKFGNLIRHTTTFLFLAIPDGDRFLFFFFKKELTEENI